MKRMGGEAGREEEKWIKRRKMANVLVNLVVNSMKIGSNLSEDRRH